MSLEIHFDIQPYADLEKQPVFGGVSLFSVVGGGREGAKLWAASSAVAAAGVHLGIYTFTAQIKASSCQATCWHTDPVARSMTSVIMIGPARPGHRRQDIANVAGEFPHAAKLRLKTASLFKHWTFKL